MVVDNPARADSGGAAATVPGASIGAVTPTRAPSPAAALLDLLLPRTCGGCGAGPPGSGGWCPACAQDTAGPVPVRVPGAGRVAAAGRYRGPLRRAVLAYKERGRRDLAPDLAGLLVGPVSAVLAPRADGTPDPAAVRLVPAPSRPSAARVRGGDHVLRLCRALAPLLTAAGLPARTDAALALHRRARDSVGLDGAGRAANLASALHPARGREPVPAARGEAVLLVDDVVTSGATLRACGAVLAASGLPAVGAVVLADASARRRPDGRL